MLAKLDHGATLIVTQLDWLARSTLDLLRIIDLFGKEDAGFNAMRGPTPRSSWTADVDILSGIAEFERDLILQRTAEGRVRTMTQGKKRPKLTKHHVR